MLIHAQHVMQVIINQLIIVVNSERIKKQLINHVYLHQLVIVLNMMKLLVNVLSVLLWIIHSVLILVIGNFNLLTLLIVLIY